MQVAQFIAYLLQVMGWLIIARSLLSWFPDLQRNAIAQVLRQITDPILIPFQRIVPRVGMFDFSPTVAVLVLFVLSLAIQRSFA